MTALAQAAANVMQTLGRLVKDLGPYAAIEILLPGGTLIAIGLWLYRSYRKRKAAGVAMTLVATPST
jgi:hypothetical protein